MFIGAPNPRPLAGWTSGGSPCFAHPSDGVHFRKVEKFLCISAVFSFSFFLFSFSLLSSRDQIRRSRPLQPTELISLRERGAIRAAEAGDVPVRHLINSLIAAGQKEDPFLRIGESGRQRYKACLRGRLAQDKVCPSAQRQKRARVLRVW